MRRCDVVIVALPGDKPRPALVLQSDELMQSASVIVCPFTSSLEFASPHRVVMEAATANGLKSASVLMTEKMQAIRREKCGDVIGHLTASEMLDVETQLAFVLGLGSAGTS